MLFIYIFFCFISFPTCDIFIVHLIINAHAARENAKFKVATQNLPEKAC